VNLPFVVTTTGIFHVVDLFRSRLEELVGSEVTMAAARALFNDVAEFPADGSLQASAQFFILIARIMRCPRTCMELMCVPRDDFGPTKADGGRY
jgi:hypothetical protein